MRTYDAPNADASVEKRSRSHLLLLDSECRIVLGETEAIRLLFPDVTFASGGRAQLSSELCELVRERLAAIGSRDAAVVALGDLVLRLVPLSGPLGTFTAISIEGMRRREDLASQIKAYRLTPREVDVLKLILQGLKAAEVAVALNITKNTATDYFKSLLRKTESRNRSEMISKILGWRRSGP
jgi:DNA-binding CsgD family transcriptional regulator